MDIYLITVLLSLYGININFEINAPGHGKNDVDGLSATEKRYLREQVELLGKLASNDPSKVVTLPSASNNVSINFAEKYSKNLTNND